MSSNEVLPLLLLILHNRRLRQRRRRRLMIAAAVWHEQIMQEIEDEDEDLEDEDEDEPEEDEPEELEEPEERNIVTHRDKGGRGCQACCQRVRVGSGALQRSYALSR